MKDAAYWIEALDLARHPEGGWFRETYRSPETLPADALPARFGGGRSMSTAICFLLEGNDFSALHRIKSDELWHFYAGSPLAVHVIGGEGAYRMITLGSDPDRGEVFQAAVEAGSWFGASLSNAQSYALVGCTVAPGFDFADFEMGERERLCAEYPGHREIIERLTRG